MARSERIAILVDSENLEIAVHQQAGGSNSRSKQTVFPEWKRILAELVGPRSLVRLIYFKEKGRKLSKKFETFWQDECLGEIQRPVKSADPAMIITAVTLAEKMDCVVLISGDKDFLPLLPFLKAKGCKVEVASFEQSVSGELKRAADRYYRLGKKHTVTLQRTK